MSRAPKPPRVSAQKGRGGAHFIAFALMGGAGLALDLTTRGPGAFWLGAEPGARALIGLGAAAFVLICAHVARFVLAKREAKGGRDAGDHA